MKKIFLTAVFLFTSLYANSGEEIYKAQCMACHKMQGMMNKSQMQEMRQKMQNATQEEKMAMKQTMMQKMQKSDMKAPPMPMVSKRLKMMLKTRKEFIIFVEDYIQNPSKEKGFCMPMAYKRFGTMPPIGKSLSKEERTAVASWLYDNFKGSWGGSMGGKMCEMRNKSMKCGAEKCGGQGSRKCGAVKIPTH